MLFPVFNCLVFHKYYVLTPHHFLVRYIPQPIAKFILWVPEEYAWFRLVVGFRPLILGNMLVWQTSKHLQLLIRRIFSCPYPFWNITFQGHWGRPIDEINSCQHGFNPIWLSNLCMWQHAPHSFHYSSIYPLCKPIQLWGLRHCVF